MTAHMLLASPLGSKCVLVLRCFFSCLTGPYRCVLVQRVDARVAGPTR